jgi:hypothetical protein
LAASQPEGNCQQQRKCDYRVLHRTPFYGEQAILVPVIISNDSALSSGSAIRFFAWRSQISDVSCRVSMGVRRKNSVRALELAAASQGFIE